MNDWIAVSWPVSDATFTVTTSAVDHNRAKSNTDNTPSIHLLRIVSQILVLHIIFSYYSILFSNLNR